MKLSSKYMAWTVAAAIVGTTLVGSSTLTAQKTTTKDGVFSAVQAERGAALYKQMCSGCHAADLSGGPGAQLAGADFLGYWDKSSLFELVTIVKENMPQLAPGSLTKTETVDVVSFILNSNKMPAGSADLSMDDAVLKEIVIVK